MKKSESGLFSSAGTLSRPGYFEVDIDVGSTALATNATHLAGGYAKNLVLDLGFALQVVTACLMSSGGSVPVMSSVFVEIFVTRRFSRANHVSVLHLVDAGRGRG